MPSFVDAVYNTYIKQPLHITKTNLVENSCPTLKRKYSRVHLPLQDCSISLQNLITEESNEKVPMTIRVPITMQVTLLFFNLSLALLLSSIDRISCCNWA